MDPSLVPKIWEKDFSAFMDAFHGLCREYAEMGMSITEVTVPPGTLLADGIVNPYTGQLVAVYVGWQFESRYD